MAVFLRMAYIAGAVLFVLIINRFFFPTSLGSQVRYNLQLLFHMHHMYLRMLEDSLSNQLDYWRICDAQIQYHTVLAQIRNDLPQVEKDDKDREYYNKILNITWCMASEIQQMFFQVKHKSGSSGPQDHGTIYSVYRLRIEPDPGDASSEKGEEAEEYQGSKVSALHRGRAGTFSLMVQYARNLSRLYVLVLKRVR